MLKYLYITKSEGIYFWRQQKNDNLEKGNPPTINSNLHDLFTDGRPKDDPQTIATYVDSDWAGCPRTRRSFMGTCMRLEGGTIAYKSQLYPSIAQLSSEAEFMAACQAGNMILFVRNVLWDIGVSPSVATLLYEDNDACTAMANARKPTSRTRHMDIKFNVLCEWTERDLILLRRVDTAINMADHFTKQLGPTLFHRHIDYIMGHVPPSYSSRFRTITGSSKKHQLEQEPRSVVSKMKSCWY